MMKQLVELATFAVLLMALTTGRAAKIVEGNESVEKSIKNMIPTKWKNSLKMDKVVITGKNIDVTGWKNLRRNGPCEWIKNYEGPGNNWDIMNLTLSADNLKVTIDELSIGELKGRFSFDVKENMFKVVTSSQGFVSPGKCLVNFYDIDVQSLTGVIMHSDVKVYEGLDMTTAANALLPFVNRFIKTKQFETYLQNMAGKECVIKITDVKSA